jgi:multiple sugar transport system permease protein
MDTSRPLPSTQAAPSIKSFRTTKTWQNSLRLALSYLVLLFGAGFMLFPLLWMLSSSFKPTWQIFTDPPIWIPQEWEHVRAGDTNRMLSLWHVDIDGESRQVIEIGTRRYTTVVDGSLLQNLQSVPGDQLGEAASTLVGTTLLNVRPLVSDSTAQVVALARDGDNMIIANLNDIQAAVSRLPLDEVNAGERADITVGGVEFRGREVTTEAGTQQVIPLGPESALTIVGPPEIAADAILIPAEQLEDADFASIGDTELRLSRIVDDTSETPYVTLSIESWQPVINEEAIDTQAFIAQAQQLGEREVLPVGPNNVAMQVAEFTPEGDEEPYAVTILISGTTSSLVIPAEQTDSLRLAQLGGLTSARGDSYGRIPYRVQDGFVEGEALNSVALVGDPRDMALIVPQTAVTDAFDVSPDQMQRSTHTELRLDGYREALETKVAETRFPTFFKNSFILVFLNCLGHVLSCVVTAYAFARLRAPGKGFLFLILLSTMMLPFPVTIVPLYELFRDMGLINTLGPLFIRSFFGNAFLIFMLRQFFASIPRELEEAARIDGANVLQVLWNVIVPLSKPAIATVIIFTFWWYWNSFLEPFIYLSSPELFPVSVGLNFFKDQYGTIYFDRLIAASVMSMVPMIVLFFFAQRYFIEGIQLTGMKG